jgi:ABC-type antimicrobial peptide transport system ATPase subunit
METEIKGSSIKELPMEIQEILKNIEFPVKKNDIIEQERKSGAIPDILRELGMLPDKEYNSVEDVAEELQRLYIGTPS